MKSAFISLFWMLFLVGVPDSALAEGVDANLLSELSTCALDCLIEKAPLVNCQLLDIACQCSRTNFTGIVTNCMLANCTLEESLELVKVDSLQCNRPHNNHHAAIEALAVGTPIIVYLAILFRIVGRLWTIRNLWWDDYFHILGGGFIVPLSIFANLCANHGFGYHLYDIHFTSVYEAYDLLFWYYLCQIFWALAIYCVKISILCLYLRIFTSKRFRIVTYAATTFLSLSIIILLPMVIWQCNPIFAAWQLDLKNAHCLSISDVAYANAAVNIATEAIILVLPLPMLHTLRIAGKKKVALYALIGVGLLVIGIAAARIPTLSHIATMNDPTYNNVPAYLWTCSELIVVNICAAAPAVRSFMSRVKNEIWTMTSLESSRDRFGSGMVRFAGIKILSSESSSQQGSIHMVSLLTTGSEKPGVKNGCTEEKLMDIKINSKFSIPRRHPTVTTTTATEPWHESKPLPKLPHSPRRQGLSPSEYAQNAVQQTTLLVNQSSRYMSPAVHIVNQGRTSWNEYKVDHCEAAIPRDGIGSIPYSLGNDGLKDISETSNV